MTIVLKETQGVPVITYGDSKDFPAFFTPKSGFQVLHIVALFVHILTIATESMERLDSYRGSKNNMLVLSIFASHANISVKITGRSLT